MLDKLSKFKSKTKGFVTLLRAGLGDLLRYHKFSRSSHNIHQTGVRAHVTVQYHVVEKGLTMPDFRLGFGQDRVVALGRTLLKNSSLISCREQTCHHAMKVLQEYAAIHKEYGYQLREDTRSVLAELEHLMKVEATRQHSRIGSSDQYFAHANSNFDLFSKSRKSLRNFSEEEVRVETIEKALELCRWAPSACNRQSWRTYVYTNLKKIQEILKLQGGNRGFGHLTNKLIVVTAELGVFCQANERNQAFVDGGMYAMNLLYCLHYHHVGACVMNCAFFPNREKSLRELCQIKESEVFIVMVACGQPSENYKIAESPRFPVSDTNQVFQ